MYSFLKNWLTPAYEELLERYTEYPQEYSLEEIDGYTYFLFCYPVLPEVEQWKMKPVISLWVYSTILSLNPDRIKHILSLKDLFVQLLQKNKQKVQVFSIIISGKNIPL